MHAITQQEITTEILSLFDLSQPTMPRAFSVLEGITRGQILIDHLPQPRWAVVRDATYGTLYIGGQIDSSLIPSIFNHFFQFGDIGVGCWLNDPLNNILPATPDYDGFTLYFRERSPEILSDSLVHPLPPGYTLATRDEGLFSQSFEYASTLEAFGSLEKVMQYTLGISLIHENLLVCEAATGAPSQGFIEIGVTTHENFRQQGLATIACAKLIDLCESQGFSTWWDCAKQNTASARLARKLGYRNEQEYRYVWWKKR